MKATQQHLELLPLVQQEIERQIERLGSKSALAKQMKRSAGHITNFQKGDLNNISEAVFDEFCNYFNVGLKDDWKTFSTPNYKTVTKVCEKAHAKGEFHAIGGFTGAGKSVALRKYCDNVSNAVYIEFNCETGKKSLLRKLQHSLGMDEGGTSEVMLESVLLKLRKTKGKLIVFDDMHKVRENAILLLQPIWEACKGRHGLVICGTEYLYTLIKNRASRNKMGFRELRRRVDHWQSLSRPSALVIKTIAGKYGIEDKHSINFLKEYSQDYDTLRKYILKGREVAEREGISVNREILASLEVGDSQYEMV